MRISSTEPSSVILCQTKVEYVQNCDILDQLDEKLCLQDSSFFLTFGYWNGIEIMTNYFEN